jgi:hypothetical protein
MTSDDPEYAATLAGLLGDAGQLQEADQWRISAAARYDELVSRHPEAFLDHAAEFWLNVGGDRWKGRQLALRSYISRAAGASALLRHVTAWD